MWLRGSFHCAAERKHVKSRISGGQRKFESLLARQLAHLRITFTEADNSRVLIHIQQVYWDVTLLKTWCTRLLFHMLSENLLEKAELNRANLEEQVVDGSLHLQSEAVAGVVLAEGKLVIDAEHGDSGHSCAGLGQLLVLFAALQDFDLQLLQLRSGQKG